jgi:hypothetical protein
MDCCPLTSLADCPINEGMTHETILEELEDYCRATGLKPSTVCVRALNDSRYVARHQRRLDALNRDANKIRQYMAENPAPAGTDHVAAE